MNYKMKEYIFLWFIENYSYSWHKNGERLTSPNFIAEGLGNTVWTIRLNPRGRREEDRGHISLCLHRSTDDHGPENISIMFELTILAANGSPHFTMEHDQVFERGFGCGCGDFLPTNEILLQTNTGGFPPRLFECAM